MEAPFGEGNSRNGVACYVMPCVGMAILFQLLPVLRDEAAGVDLGGLPDNTRLPANAFPVSYTHLAVGFGRSVCRAGKKKYAEQA